MRASHWVTFLGQPVLGELGGAEGLQARLSFSGTMVESLEGDRVAVILGRTPEAGDLEAGRDLPRYRELARVLEPWLYQRSVAPRDLSAGHRQRWERRFLD